VETEESLRGTLTRICEKGVRPASIADRAGVSRACLSKFMSGRSKYLRSDIFIRICGIARADVQRLRL